MTVEMGPEQEPLIRIERLMVDIRVDGQFRTVIHDVSLELWAGESVGLVGESGSGKSMTIKAITRLLPRASEVRGRITYDGVDVYTLDRERLRAYRAEEVAQIHQVPQAHINPLRTAGDFLTEGLVFNRGVPLKEATERALEMLRRLSVSEPEKRMTQYPHELSGGLLQRVLIAAAMLMRPRLLLADEPTSALDVTTQQDVVAIIQELQESQGLTLLLVTHDLDLATAITDRVAVMYAGTIVEVGQSDTIHEEALHPYTIGLLNARPELGSGQTVKPIPGKPASAFEVGSGCVFVDRCPFATDMCREIRPQPRLVEKQMVACHRAEGVRDGTLRWEDVE